MGVSKNSGTPKSSILIGISIINHPFWGTPIFGNTHMVAFLPFLPFLLVLNMPATAESVVLTELMLSLGVSWKGRKEWQTWQDMVTNIVLCKNSSRSRK